VAESPNRPTRTYKSLGWLGAGRVLAGLACGFALMAAGMTGLGARVLGGQDSTGRSVDVPARPELIPGIEAPAFTGGALPGRPAAPQPLSPAAAPTPLGVPVTPRPTPTVGPAAAVQQVDAGGQVDSVPPAPPARAASLDTDGDGMPDGWELAYGLNPRIDLDANADPDHDGVSNLNEYRLGTNPRVADSTGKGVSDGHLDSDGDGLPNSVEQKLGLDPSQPSTPPRDRDLTRTARNAVTPAPTKDVMSAGDVPSPTVAPDAKPSDGTLDSDGDGLPNALEVRMGLDPTKAETHPGIPDGKTDSDGDGLPSALEVVLGLDPMKADSDGNGTPDGREDSDGDGLNNLVELALGLNPAVVDSDHNGVPDGQEDTDGDGMSNAAELAVGRDPTTPDPAPPVIESPPPSAPAPAASAPAPATPDPAPAAPAPDPAPTPPAP
jgi:hypothetical protein